jgi:hypothetical protein
MKDRIQAFLQSENKSYAQFAEEIGVQPLRNISYSVWKK